MTQQLTQNEIDTLTGIVNSDFRDGNHPVNCAVWTWSANPFDSKRIFSGVVASTNKKGLTWSTNEGEDSVIALTQEGWDALQLASPEFTQTVKFFTPE